MSLLLTIDSAVEDLVVGLVEVRGATIAPPEPELTRQCRARVEEVFGQGCEGGDERRLAVRGLLRHGGFKPSGRNKPAQEYLLRLARGAGQWPAILNAVDVLNVVSLGAGLPISLVALNRLRTPFLIRYGRPREAFVFNAAGQTLDVEGLLCVCHCRDGETEPVGTPVKDSQLGKVTLDDSHLLACIFAPRSSVPLARLQFWTDQLAAGLTRWCAPSSVDTWLMPSDG